MTTTPKDSSAAQDNSPEDRDIMRRDFERSIYDKNPPGDAGPESAPQVEKEQAPSTSLPPATADTPRKLLGNDALERIWQAKFQDLRHQELRRVFEQAIAANELCADLVAANAKHIEEITRLDAAYAVTLDEMSAKLKTETARADVNAGLFAATHEQLAASQLDHATTLQGFELAKKSAEEFVSQNKALGGMLEAEHTAREEAERKLGNETLAHNATLRSVKAIEQRVAYEKWKAALAKQEQPHD